MENFIFCTVKFVDERNIVMSAHWCFPVIFSGGGEMGHITLYYISPRFLSFTRLI